MGMYGFTQTLAKEGESKNIKINTICPLAGSRMTKGIMPEPIWQGLNPKYIAPLAVFLAHDSCEESGSIFEVGTGYVSTLRWQRTQGALMEPHEMSPETIAKNWEKINDFEHVDYPTSAQDTLAILVGQIKKIKAEPVKPKAAPKAAAPAGASDLKSARIFDLMSMYLEIGEGADMIKSVQATYNFEINKKKGAKPSGVWYIDLKNGKGFVRPGAEKKVDATFTMTDADFEKVCDGSLNPQMAFMEGKMKIKGNIAKATKFTPELFPSPTQENFEHYIKKAQAAGIPLPAAAAAAAGVSATPAAQPKPSGPAALKSSRIFDLMTMYLDV